MLEAENIIHPALLCCEWDESVDSSRIKRHSTFLLGFRNRYIICGFFDFSSNSAHYEISQRAEGWIPVSTETPIP